ncbi:MAG TPA: bifunctional 2-polyprenyl-6-hydroxyphenol methylase/3-demethylubiquinol 3-O-methyltransferase UbiG [Ferrovibrio sp.]|uniref:bifunctional 2-polyprenyl-6-hydroxyphenol methylase/3-demethylubiquinol 3-O-methyltransferase UbiG n=1 Tax=Ferrovibrio sp. TaxID=1917215 RepID=UPI002B4B30BA|nr:bifunctional 2-polyprenyl-6-hydroxyphenol methylase/3-demethylubiquinol 3-O-methyltransferase UbiG [Ferrovibrio sp.]HLT76983.1 bifunctional 2-polyprenyl-6-hydroxyphenol methylase/3-demethylubiquinol 3-O-methyltransferase UbiG [Ferrovibrio sp.]
MTQAASIDPAEIARFSAMAAEWWNPQGKFRPLHRFNPVRLGFIRDRIAAHFGRDPAGPEPLAGLRLLDIGCGGGLVAEPMARLGARVVGADASERNIGVARLHAAESGVEVDYRCTSAEDLAAAGETFDVVLTLEVVEHVADLEGFLRCCGQMVKPGGLLIAATLNRTLKAYALAIVGAEYLLRWLPPGTHEWKKFVRPHELAAGLRHAGLTVSEITGVSYDPLADRWRLGRDTDVNYMMVATKP